MAKPDKETIFKDLLAILYKVGEDWEFSDEITPDTFLLEGLDLESIDVVVLGEYVEEFYGQSFPFTEYITERAQQDVADFTIGEMIDLIYANFKTA